MLGPNVPSSPPERFSAVIFDMDGLLLDSERPLLEAWQAVAAEHGVRLARERFVQLLGRSGAEVRTLFRALFPADLPIERARAEVRARLAAERASGPFALMAGARALLERLARARIPLAVASSTKREQVEQRLREADLLAPFSALVGGDEVSRGKPAPDIFLLAAERLGVAPQRCLVFEDLEHGTRGAVAAGMQCVIVPDLKPPSDEARALCLAVLPSLAHVDDRFEGWFGLAAPP